MAFCRRRLPISRRRFVQGVGVAGLGLLAGCGRLSGQAQPPASIARIGYLSPVSRAGDLSRLEGFQQGLREHGLVEGHNIAIDYRWADGVDERLPALAAELADSRVNVIVTLGVPAATAAKSATGTIPIVNLNLADPVGAGVVASLARPGGNLTGLATDAGPAQAGKRLQLLSEAVPGVSRVAALWHPDPGQSGRLSDTQDAGRALGIAVQAVPVRGPDDFDSAFDAIVRERTEAILMLGSLLLFENRTRIAEFTLPNRLPSIGVLREFADAGHLMAYGPSLPALARRGAAYVDKILKGANPADLPVEQPREFDFVINLKTAQALGLTIPQQVLLQATEILQ